MITLDIKDRTITIAADKDKEFTAIGYETDPMGALSNIYAINAEGKMIKAPWTEVTFKVTAPKSKG